MKIILVESNKNQKHSKILFFFLCFSKYMGSQFQYDISFKSSTQVFQLGIYCCKKYTSSVLITALEPNVLALRKYWIQRYN